MSSVLESPASAPARYQRIFLAVAEDCCAQLFAGYGYPLVPASPAAGATLAYFGIIGFTATALNGSLVLGCSEEALSRSNPAKAVHVREWVGELANQLVGRVKNQLLLYALELRVDTPVTLRETHMSQTRTQGLPSISLQGQGGLVRVWIDLQLGRGFQMATEPDPSRAGPGESQTVML
jgi:hypothetical protein